MTSAIAGAGGLHARLLRNLGYLAGGASATAAFTMVAVAFNARALPADLFGLLVLLQTSALLLRGITSLSPQQPLIHLGSEALEQGDPDRLGRVIGHCLLYDLGGALAALALGSAVVALGGNLLGLVNDHREAAWIFVGALPLMNYLSATGIFRLFNRFGLMSSIQAACALAVMVMAGLFYAIEAPFEVYVWTWAVYLAGVSQLQLWTAMAIIARRGIRVSWRGYLSERDKRKISAYCWSSWANAVVDTIRAQGDSLLVGAMVSVESAGFYNVARQVAGVARKVSEMYTSAMFPEVAALNARASHAAARRLWRHLLLAGLLLTAGGVIGAALFGRPLLMTLFGADFGVGYGALVVLIGAAGLQTVANTQSVYLQVYLSPGRLFPIYLAALGAFVATAIAGLHFFGITGAAAGQATFTLVIILLASITLRGKVPKSNGQEGEGVGTTSVRD